MKTNGTNPGMSVEDYEDMAVQKSNVAKRAAAGAAIFLGGATVAGTAAYAAGHPEMGEAEAPLTIEDVVGGAEAGSDYQPVEEAPAPAPTPNPAPQQQTTQEESPITWDETTNYYVDGEKVGSMEEGTVDGHNFALIDIDGDEHADILAIDIDDNGRFDDNEYVTYSVSDHVHMGHETAQVTNEHYQSGYSPISTPEGEEIAQYEEPVHNNFEDEKTGESYEGDFAENNPDYNPNGQVDNYEANIDYLAENESYEEETGTYDSMMESEEFLG